MASARLKVLTQAVARHPWSSLQDALLVAMAMLVATLLALQYNLFSFVAELSEPQRKISIAEAIFLTILLAACIFAFILHRLHEARRDAAHQVVTKARLREFRWRASRDSLTNLANRGAMLRALAAVAASSDSEAKTHAFFLIDLNDFKRVNDLQGHALGDRVLQVIARRLRRSVRPGDLLARLGGDEFALLCCDVNREAALEIALRFIASLEDEITVRGRSYKIGASVGAALIPEHGTNAEEIIHHADLAMYRAKSQDGSSVAFFEPKESGPKRKDGLTAEPASIDQNH
jgi:diguanylate cyclase (GGDEF)-like protein